MPINSGKTACFKVLKSKLKSGKLELLNILSTCNVTLNDSPDGNTSLGINSRVLSSIQLLLPSTFGSISNNFSSITSFLMFSLTGSMNLTLIEVLLDKTPDEKPEITSVN